jgi:hypothetical protein
MHEMIGNEVSNAESAILYKAWEANKLRTHKSGLGKVKDITICQWPTYRTRSIDLLRIGDEHGLQGRFQQDIGQAFGVVVEAKSINLYFADFKSSGSNYGNISDVVGLQDVGGNTTIKLVGELKTPWVIKHDLHSAVRRIRELRQKIAQPVRDMQALGCDYGFISTYNHTIFLRQLQSPSGTWEVWYSPPISSSSYHPTVPNP